MPAYNDGAPASDATPAAPVAPRGMGSRTVRALFWLVLDNGGSQALSFAVYAVLARLLHPSQFGVFSLAVAITLVASILLRGLDNALVQLDNPSQDDLSTAFWANLALGIALALGMIAAAPGFATLFHARRLDPTLRALSPIFIFRALASIPEAVCRRELRMSVFAIRTAAGYAVGGAAAITLALLGWGIAALVAFQVVQSGVSMLTTWLAVGWRPHLRFAAASFLRLRRFSLHFVMGQLLVTFAEKSDSLAIGLFLNVTVLGYYDLALKLIVGIAVLAMAPFQSVAMPVLSRLAHDRAAFSASFTQLVVASAAVWTPAACCLGAAAPILIPLAFGEHWRGAVPVLQAMCFGCVLVPVLGLTGGALAAAGRSELYVWTSAAQLGVAVVTYGVAAQFGIVAIGWAWVAVSLFLLPVHLTLLHRASGVRVLALMTRVGRVAASGALMASVILALRYATNDAVWAIVAGMLAGGILYLASLELVTLRGFVSGVLRAALQALPA